MLDFAHPYLLLLLLALPVAILLYWLSKMSMKRKIRRFGQPSVISRLMPDVSKYKPAIKLTLELIALAAIVLVLARPRHGEKEDRVRTEGSEIVIAFDLSQSMLASSTDDPGGASRLERSRLLLEKLVSKLQDDKVGLVVFAGNARMQVPLTTDYHMLRLALRNDLRPGSMTFQGTSISEAIDMATLSFPGMRGEEGEAPKRKKDDKTNRAIIIITDAEDHEGDAIERAHQAVEQGIQVNVVGVGSARGGLIPIGKGQYLRDAEGKEVVTTFNEQAAQAIAKAGDGVYVNASSADALDTLVKSLDELAKSEFKDVTYKMSAEQFPLFAWIAIIALIFDIIIVSRKTKWLKDINFFSRNQKK